MSTPLNSPNPIWLVDASIYIFRAWFVKELPLLDTQGQAINAVRGFLRWVALLIQSEHPEYIAFAFDTSKAHSLRRELYPLYKAHRPSAPDNLKYQLDLCRDFIAALGITHSAVKGYEADDIIGTWVHQQAPDQPCHIISGDKDLMQLVREGDIWWDYGRREPLNRGKVKREVGVWPEQVAAQLALCGDVADNIPGIDGLGAATAARILNKFNSLDILFSRLPEMSQLQIRGAKLLQQRISENKAQIELNYQLTKIHCAVPDLPTALKRGAKNLDKLQQLGQRLQLTDEQMQIWINI